MSARNQENFSPTNPSVGFMIATDGYDTKNIGFFVPINSEMFSADVGTYPQSYSLDWTSPNSTLYHFVFENGSFDNAIVTCDFWTQSTYTLFTTAPAATISQITTQAYTTPVISNTIATSNSPPSSLQFPQPPQPIISSVALVFAAITAVALAALILHSRRKEQPKVRRAEKVESTPKKSGNFCIDCGSELPLKSKFCNNCGTKQN
jgi:hypothetical protein